MESNAGNTLGHETIRATSDSGFSPQRLISQLISLVLGELSKLPQIERDNLLSQFGLTVSKPWRGQDMFVDVKSGVQRGIDDLSMIPDDSLLFFYGNVYSQTGQDGILTEIFRRLDIRKGRFVEFGGWDGVHLSNCRWLAEKGWSGVFIEADEFKFENLKANYENCSRIHCLKGFVSTSESDNLLSFVSKVYHREQVNDLDLVNIDIDGLDLEVTCAMGFTPKVLLIEGGSNFDPSIEVPCLHPERDVQHPLGWIIKKIRDLGYEPVCFLQDLYAVRRDLASKVLNRAGSLTSVELYNDCYQFRGSLWRFFISRKRNQNDAVAYFKTTTSQERDS